MVDKRNKNIVKEQVRKDIEKLRIKMALVTGA